MKLSDYFSDVYRDAEFETLGKVNADPGGNFLTFAGEPKFARAALRNPKVSAVICPDDTVEMIPANIGVVLSSSIKYDFFTLHNRLCDDEGYTGHRVPTAIPESCKIHPTALIGEYNVVMGERCVIEEFVTIKDNVTLGDDCVVRAGSVIGATQFEITRHNNQTLSARHCGKVDIGNNVEIQSLSIVGKGVFPYQTTKIGDFTKVGGQVDIAHGCSIGSCVLMANGVAVAGFTSVGDDVWIGPRANISSQLRIGDKAHISIGSVVVSNIKDGQKVSGNPAVDHSLFLKNYTKLFGRG